VDQGKLLRNTLSRAATRAKRERERCCGVMKDFNIRTSRFLSH
jgi:hypothetical protein